MGSFLTGWVRSWEASLLAGVSTPLNRVHSLTASGVLCLKPAMILPGVCNFLMSTVSVYVWELVGTWELSWVRVFLGNGGAWFFVCLAFPYTHYPHILATLYFGRVGMVGEERVNIRILFNVGRPFTGGIEVSRCFLNNTWSISIEGPHWVRAFFQHPDGVFKESQQKTQIIRGNWIAITTPFHYISLMWEEFAKKI